MISRPFNQLHSPTPAPLPWAVWGCVGIATVLWFIMFSPLTAPHVPFWWTMAASGVLLTSLSFAFGGNPLKGSTPLLDNLIWGILIAGILWGVFWIGDKLSQLLFDFARPQVDLIYGMRSGFSPAVIALLLLFIIGPAEELFWRGYVQRMMARQWGRCSGFIVATLCYSLIHVFSGNFMLFAAAGVCGVCWGGLYMLFPRRLPMLIVSHALWDVMAFVLWPI